MTSPLLPALERLTPHELPTFSTWLLDLCSAYRGYPPVTAPGVLDLGWLLLSLTDDDDIIQQREASLRLIAGWSQRASALVAADRGPDRPIEVAIWTMDVKHQRIVEVTGALAVARDGAPLIVTSNGSTILFSLNTLADCPGGLRDEDAQSAMLRARFMLDHYLSNEGQR